MQQFCPNKLIKMRPVKKILAACTVWLLVNVLYPFFDVSNYVADRQLSISYGNGECKWQPPAYYVPDDITFYKTMVVGYPSGDKRLMFIQMEALTGWPAKDEWDFKYIGQSNHPFIKSNYPHHEGTWGWGDNGDQAVMVVRNIRRAMVEYHDILWDIAYAATWEDAFKRIPNLYSQRPPLDAFYAWRDLRVLDEVHWYGWFIDYWMEGGLLRDWVSHNITTPYHWRMSLNNFAMSKDEIAKLFVRTDERSYDPNCENVTRGCKPVKILSGELLVDPRTGPAENRKVGEVLMNDPRMSKWVIEEVAWECIWTELIINRKGVKTFIDRGNLNETDYNFSDEMLEAMISELDRLIWKYSADDWYTKEEIARDLVTLLESHREMILQELQLKRDNPRELKDSDFLGPKEREKRKMERIVSSSSSGMANLDDERMLNTSEDYSEYFKALALHLQERRQRAHKEEVIENERRRRARHLHEKKNQQERQLNEVKKND